MHQTFSLKLKMEASSILTETMYCLQSRMLTEQLEVNHWLTFIYHMGRNNIGVGRKPYKMQNEKFSAISFPEITLNRAGFYNGRELQWLSGSSSSKAGASADLLACKAPPLDFAPSLGTSSSPSFCSKSGPWRYFASSCAASVPPSPSPCSVSSAISRPV